MFPFLSLETDRLLLRRYTPDDFNQLRTLHTDAEVMRFVKPIDTPEETQAYLDMILEGYVKDPHLGRMAVIDKATGDFVGNSMIKYFNEAKDVELGYVLHKRYWSKGLASEITKALIDYCFNKIDIQRIIAICRPDNEGSWRVMEKCGMRRIGYSYIPAYKSHNLVYEIVVNPPIQPIFQTPLLHLAFSEHQGDYTLTTDKGKMNLKVIFDYLHHDSYWAKGISMEKVERSFNNSLTFGILYQQNQVGYARVITDFATFAYLADVFVLPEHRGKGLSKWLVQSIVAQPALQSLRRWVLATQDAHSLYTQYGFESLPNPENWMQIFTPYPLPKADEESVKED